MSQGNQPKKIPVSEARAILRSHGFTNDDVSTGGRSDLWIAKNGTPATISFVGPPYGEYYSEESFNNALRELLKSS
jgi:hypothetical protein